VLAGVSVKTVSNVVNDYPHVRPTTRARVRQAIETLGYRPNMTARNLRSGRSGVIALAVPELDAPYFAELAHHVVGAAMDWGWTVLVDETGQTSDRALRDRERELEDRERYAQEGERVAAGREQTAYRAGRQERRENQMAKWALGVGSRPHRRPDPGPARAHSDPGGARADLRPDRPRARRHLTEPSAAQSGDRAEGDGDGGRGARRPRVHPRHPGHYWDRLAAHRLRLGRPRRSAAERPGRGPASERSRAGPAAARSGRLDPIAVGGRFLRGLHDEGSPAGPHVPLRRLGWRMPLAEGHLSQLGLPAESFGKSSPRLLGDLSSLRRWLAGEDGPSVFRQRIELRRANGVREVVP